MLNLFKRWKQRRKIKTMPFGSERADMIYDYCQEQMNELLGDRPMDLHEYSCVTSMFMANVVAALPNRDSVNKAFGDITKLARMIGNKARDENNVVHAKFGTKMVDSQGNAPGGDVA